MLTLIVVERKKILLTCFAIAIDNIIRIAVVLRIVVIIVLSNVTVIVFFHHVHIAQQT